MSADVEERATSRRKWTFLFFCWVFPPQTTAQTRAAVAKSCFSSIFVKLLLSMMGKELHDGKEI